MIQKITLGADGIVVQKRMQPYTAGQAKATPAVGLTRLKELLKTKEPRICVVRGEGIGDVITITPTLRALKETFKKVNLTVATNTKYMNGALVKVLQYNPDVDEIIERSLLDDTVYDLVINLHCPAINYEKPRVRPISRIDIFARHAGVNLRDPRPRYYIQKDEVEEAEDFLDALRGEKLMLVQPFASTERRSLDHRKLKRSITQLYELYGVRSVIMTHSSDFPSDVLWDNVPGSVILRDADTRRKAAVMVHCDLVLCPDSVILHLAGALGVPTVAFFGPTDPAARINHYPNAVAIWRGGELGPCPCWYTACPINYTCWSMISEGDIVSSCVKHLQATERVNILQLINKDKEITIHTEVV